MLRIALTGGIGSGKSTVSRLFQQKHIPVIDTDIIAHEIIQPEQPCWHKLIKQFGDNILDDQNNINRRYLRQLIFSSAEKKQQLEQILHPQIWQEVQTQVTQLQAASHAYCIIAVPLLLESKPPQQIQFDRILVVDCDEDIQLQRSMLRDGAQAEEIMAIIRTQASRTQRCQAADDIIDNNGEPQQLQQQVEQLHHKYLQLATASQPPA